MSATATFASIDPTTGEEIARHSQHSPAEVERRVALAEQASHAWRRTSARERADALRRVADLLDERREELALLAVQEMGKPIVAARAEIDKCASVCRLTADGAEEALAPRLVEADWSRSYVRLDPLGPLLAIMPWNFPYWQVFRFFAGASLVGNTALVKHAPSTTGCSLAIEELWRDAGVPEGLLQALVIDVEDVPGLIADPRVRAVTLTGSIRAGRSVAEVAGRHGKKTVLELGGSDPLIVLPDADVALAAAVATQSRLNNSGQGCLCAKRCIVVGDMADDFVEAYRADLSAVVLGDPRDEATQIGPLAREDLRDALHEQVQRSVDAGAKAVLGANTIDPGFFYETTLLVDVETTHACAVEETFGPVAAVIRARDEDEAVRIANDTIYGLGATVISRDVERAEAIAGELDVGTVAINTVTGSHPLFPFGGVKASGYGREMGREGLSEFANVKPVWIG
jgi:succinate-semialdehyde dehydrogenase/glutarate-semialdehyde dehydrogenase